MSLANFVVSLILSIVIKKVCYHIFKNKKHIFTISKIRPKDIMENESNIKIGQFHENVAII